MSNDINMQIAQALGSIDARLANIEKNNENQWNKIEKIDNRLRSAEVKNAGVAAAVSGIMAVGITAIKSSFTGHS